MANKLTNKLTKDKLQKLVDDVSSQLTEVLAKAEEIPTSLAKVTPGNEAPAEQAPTGSSTEGPASEESSSAEPSPDASAPPTDEAPPSDDVPAEGASDGAPADPAQDAGGTVESLQAEYAALPLEEVKMHLLACKAALMSMMAQGGGDESAPDASASAPPAPDASAGTASAPPASPTEPSMQKSDLTLLERLGALEKSLKEKDEIITGFGAVAKNLERIFTGQRKSAHSVAVLNKPGTELAKSEGDIDISALNHDQIVSKLNQITASGGLSKSDKDAVITYVSGTEKDPSKIAHLLTKKN